MKKISKNRIYKIVILIGISLVTVGTIINSESSSTIISIGNFNIPEDGSDWSLLRINDVTNLGSCEITLTWDPAVVSITDVGDSDFDSMYHYIDDTTGIMNLNVFSYNALNGDFTIAKLTFEYKLNNENTAKYISERPQLFKNYIIEGFNNTFGSKSEPLIGKMLNMLYLQ